jgi:hypothetical protein
LDDTIFLAMDQVLSEFLQEDMIDDKRRQLYKLATKRLRAASVAEADALYA